MKMAMASGMQILGDRITVTCSTLAMYGSRTNKIWRGNLEREVT